MKKNWWATFTSGFFVFLFTIPLFGAIYTSVRTDNAIASGPFVWEFDSGFTHYRNAMGAAGYDFQKIGRAHV